MSAFFIKKAYFKGLWLGYKDSLSAEQRCQVLNMETITTFKKSTNKQKSLAGYKQKNAKTKTYCYWMILCTCLTKKSGKQLVCNRSWLFFVFGKPVSGWYITV